MCFDNTDDLEASSNKWLQILKNIIKASFKKIRIRESRLSPRLQLLFREKEGLRTKLAASLTQEDAARIRENLDKTEAKIFVLRKIEV